ncbi:MAG TPA: YiiG family protein [Firmicutes bacterium]|nr:YiiG family protein [Bacillota bacterium]
MRKIGKGLAVLCSAAMAVSMFTSMVSAADTYTIELQAAMTPGAPVSIDLDQYPEVKDRIGQITKLEARISGYDSWWGGITTLNGVQNWTFETIETNEEYEGQEVTKKSMATVTGDYDTVTRYIEWDKNLETIPVNEWKNDTSNFADGVITIDVPAGKTIAQNPEGGEIDYMLIYIDEAAVPSATVTLESVTLTMEGSAPTETSSEPSAETSTESSETSAESSAESSVETSTETSTETSVEESNTESSTAVTPSAPATGDAGIALAVFTLAAAGAVAVVAKKVK